MHLAPDALTPSPDGHGWDVAYGPFYPLDGLVARTKGSPATPQLQLQERALRWRKVLMPQNGMPCTDDCGY